MRNNYRNRRKRIGWTREKLAGESGVSMSTIVRAELGKTISPLATRAIEAAFALKESEPKTEVRS